MITLHYLQVLSVFKQIILKKCILRICLNMNDSMVLGLDYKGTALEKILTLCKDRGADQLTCRALWTSEDGTSQAKWISEHVTDITHRFIKYFKDTVKFQGTYLDTLEYGADRYDFVGFSTVVDEDSMAQEANKEAVKYLILRPDGHLYSKWDSKASLIF